MRKIKRFTYSNCCYLATSLTDVKIQAKKGIYVVEYSKRIAPERLYEPVTLTAEESDELDAAFEELHIDRWKDRYEDRRILDGEAWTIEVVLYDGSKRRITGTNARPSRWDKLSALIQWIRERTEHEPKA